MELPSGATDTILVADDAADVDSQLCGVVRTIASRIPTIVLVAGGDERACAQLSLLLHAVPRLQVCAVKSSGGLAGSLEEFTGIADRGVAAQALPADLKEAVLAAAPTVMYRTVTGTEDRETLVSYLTAATGAATTI